MKAKKKVNYNGEKGSGQCDRRIGKRPGLYKKMQPLPPPAPSRSVMPSPEQAALPEKAWSKKPVHEYKKIALVKFTNANTFDHFTRCLAASPVLRKCPYDMVSELLMVVPRAAIKYFDGPENKQFSTLPARRGRQPKEKPKVYEVIKVLFVPGIPPIVGEQLQLMHNQADHSKDLAALPGDNELHIDESKVQKSPWFKYVNGEGKECLLKNYVLEPVAWEAAYNIFLRQQESSKEPPSLGERWFPDTHKAWK